MAPFHDGTDHDREMLMAFVALMQAGTVGFTLQTGDLLGIGVATMGAIGAFWPAQRFQMSPSLIFIVENGVCEVHVSSILLTQLWDFSMTMSSA
jgi:hypothetical protein